MVMPSHGEQSVDHLAQTETIKSRSDLMPPTRSRSLTAIALTADKSPAYKQSTYPEVKDG
jgi:hypothetical protein